MPVVSFIHVSSRYVHSLAPYPFPKTKT